MTELMRRRRALMGVAKTGPVVPPIPSEYQRVEYISVDTTSGYVDTGIHVSVGYKIWIDAQFRREGNVVGILGFVLGYLSGDNFKSWNILIFMTPGISANAMTSRTTMNRANIDCDRNARHMFTLDSYNNLFTIDNDSASLDFSGAPVPTETLKLGITYNIDSGGKPTIWLAGYTKTDNSEHFIIPCYRKSDGVNGVYCTETETFNAFTETTTRGGNV